jgi:4-aminobutyrate--pyruvate transaminase
MLSNLATRDVETLIHPYTQLASFRETGPLVLERGEGRVGLRHRGQRLHRGYGGPLVHRARLLERGARRGGPRQMSKLPFTHLFSGRSHDPAIELAERLKEMAPMAASKIFFTSSGSEANDTQVKLVWYMNNALGRPRRRRSSPASAAITG